MQDRSSSRVLIAASMLVVIPGGTFGQTRTGLMKVSIYDVVDVE